MPSFEITTAQREIALNEADGRRGRIRLNVLNAAGEPKTCRFLITPLGGADASWFKIEGPAERPLDPNTSTDADLIVEVPADAAAGEQRVRVDVVEVSAPEEDWTRGQDLRFTVPEPGPTKPPFPWIPIAAALAVLLVVGGGLTWYLTRSSAVQVPDVIGFEQSAAVRVIRDRGLEPNMAPARNDARPAGTVAGLDPTAGSSIAAGETVNVVLSLGPQSTDRTTCFNAVQDTIAWNAAGDTRWAPSNVNRLCAGNENSTEPAQCFFMVMHGGEPARSRSADANVEASRSAAFSADVSTAMRNTYMALHQANIANFDYVAALSAEPDGDWTWQPALELCAGTTSAAGTIACFASELAGGRDRDGAVDACKRS